MLKLFDNNIIREGEEIGWIEGKSIYSRSGGGPKQKAGYYIGHEIFTSDGRKIGWVKDGSVYTTSGRTIRLEDNRRHVTGGAYDDMVRAAVRLLIGD